MKVKLKQIGNIRGDTKSHFNGSFVVQLLDRKVIKQFSNIFQSKEPSVARSSSPIHDDIGSRFHILSLPLSIILMLMIGLRLHVLDAIVSEAVLDSLGCFQNCRVRE